MKTEMSFDRVVQHEIYEHFVHRLDYYDLPVWKRLILSLVPPVVAEIKPYRIFLSYKVWLGNKPYLFKVERY